MCLGEEDHEKTTSLVLASCSRGGRDSRCEGWQLGEQHCQVILEGFGLWDLDAFVWVANFLGFDGFVLDSVDNDDITKGGTSNGGGGVDRDEIFALFDKDVSTIGALDFGDDVKALELFGDILCHGQSRAKGP